MLWTQAFTTNFHNRVKNDNTSLYITAVPTRATKRTKQVINYAEYDDNLNFDEDKDTNYEDAYSHAISNHSNHSQQQQNNFGKIATKTRHINFNEYDLSLNSQQEEILIPIRIDLEHNSNRIVDFLMWNLNETLITPEQFALITCQDMDLPTNYQQQISNSIKQQIEEYTNTVTIQLPKDIEIHVVINLSCNLDKLLYEDKFEWDLTNDQITPEIFAKYIVMDLGLSLEFLPAIAHTLHESILKLKKDIIVDGHITDVRNDAVFGREAGLRLDQPNLGSEWVPKIEELSQWEIEKREIERERNIRRLKRESMRVDDRGRRGHRRKFDELS
ncbi:hypothetical protein WICMUC_001668 [Wickerhamomyces mucosus]|uniref:Chromatin structure-remodeling complex subunit SFH1 n=1 Tax=Wickerhamomyces mucosus TaxID=1378264 RepID=A0A9P8PTM6_9ASCO|nr:hypothetical protein WICMUC_001668 [Wickerhamomyces mucosus]